MTLATMNTPSPVVFTAAATQPQVTPQTVVELSGHTIPVGTSGFILIANALHTIHCQQQRILRRAVD